MQRKLELDRLLDAWWQLGRDLHPEDAFLCRWLCWLSPAPAAREAARAIAHAALDQIDGPDGDWTALSMPMLLGAMPDNDRAIRLLVAQRFVVWLTDTKTVGRLRGQQWLCELARVCTSSDRKERAPLAA